MNINKAPPPPPTYTVIITTLLKLERYYSNLMNLAVIYFSN